jgi:ATP-dependent RNA helicase RhlE
MGSKSGNTHEKSKKNNKINKGGSYKFKIAAKYKKPKTRGDKTFNKKNKK